MGKTDLSLLIDKLQDRAGNPIRVATSRCVAKIIVFLAQNFRTKKGRSGLRPMLIAYLVSAGVYF